MTASFISHRSVAPPSSRVCLTNVAGRPVPLWLDTELRLPCWLLQTRHFPFFIIRTVSVLTVSMFACFLGGLGRASAWRTVTRKWVPTGSACQPYHGLPATLSPLSGQGSGVLQPRALSSFAFRLPVCFRMEARWLNPILGKGGVRISLPLSDVPRE